MEKKLLLIDGNAILHRAYHALPPLTDKKGQVVNAVYGFFSMLLKLLEDLHPMYLIVCFDRPKPTFRQALFAGYQQNRPKMADELSAQIGILHEALKEVGVQIFELDGYEADDVIGTIARQATASSKLASSVQLDKELNAEKLDAKRCVVIVSGDRDLLQLVNDKVKVLAPITGITKFILFDEKAVEDKYGIKTSQFIDYKALIGDQSDGYPGITGIGPKTASSLLQKYNSFEKIYHNLGELSPRISEKLAVDAEQAALAKKLATIEINAPVTADFDLCKTRKDLTGKMKKVFGDLGFTSLIKRLESQTTEKENEPASTAKRGEQLGLL